ncbi:MAG TPA: hypothetical protein VN613_08375 [Gemmatimonadaceae bacterium]|nr:hypothetical protein [Gemmatimonadaceae bacterium]
MKALTLLVLCAGIAHPQTAIPERTLGAPTVVGVESFRNIAAVRELSDGRLIVVERAPVSAMMRSMMAGVVARMGRGRSGRGGPTLDSMAAPQPTRAARVLMLDAKLATATPVALQGAGSGELSQPEGLVAGLKDTTLLIDVGRGDIPVIDPAGRIVASRAIPTAPLALLAPGGIAVDGSGRLLYQPFVQQQRNTSAGVEIVTPDTAPIMAFDFKTGGTIPVAQVHVEERSSTMESDSTRPGSMRMRMKTFPFPTIDDWVVMRDGTLAIIRGADLHIDWIAPNGKRQSSPPIPYAKVAVTDSDKVKFRSRMDAVSGLTDSMPMMPRNLSMTQITPDSFPAFKPPFILRGAKAAPDGTIWLPASYISPASTDGYYVVGRDGRIREHIHLMKGQRLVGFGNGVVYVAVNQGPQDNRVARVPLR